MFYSLHNTGGRPQNCHVPSCHVVVADMGIIIPKSMRAGSQLGVRQAHSKC